MSLTPDLLDELELLNLFDLGSTQGGLKVHHDAEQRKISAASRLFDKGMTTRSDGGYLTDRGVETTEHVQILIKMLSKTG
ncbi:MAG: TIGR02647 family protein [Kangiellaceae bacterium]|nr:TIGR02647 family protein [Kangiellaceae bacterium]